MIVSSPILSETRKPSVHRFRRLGRELVYCPQTNDLIDGRDVGDDEILAALEQALALRRSAGDRGAPSTASDGAGREGTWREVTSLDLMMTRRCNLRCSYCFYVHDWASRGIDQGRAMGREVALASLKMLREPMLAGRRCAVRLTGAEPLMNKPLVFEVLEHGTRMLLEARGNYRLFTMVTNGTLIDPETADRLAPYPIGIQLSLDGPASCHDQHRRTSRGDHGSHHLAERAAHLLRSRFRSLTISAVWTSGGPTVGERVAYFEQLGATSIKIAPTRPAIDGADRAGMQAPDYQKLAAELEAHAPAVIDAYRAGRPPAYQPFERAWRFLDGVGSAEREICNPLSQGNRTVDVDGGLYPCYGFVGSERYRMGTVLEPRMTSPDFTVERRAANDACRSCWAWRFCGGGDLCVHPGMVDCDPGLFHATCGYLRAKTELALATYDILRPRRRGQGRTDHQGPPS